MIIIMIKNKSAKIVQDFILGKRNLEDTVNKLSNKIEKSIIKECERAINMRKNKTALVIVDMQNDFITGALGSVEAKAIVPLVYKYIQNFKGKYIAVTKDYHCEKNYKDYIEGQKIPLHCELDTEGIEFNKDIKKAIEEKIKNEINIDWFYKNTFGCISLADYMIEVIKEREIDTIYIVGLCTDICVISNALILRAACPNTRIIVLKDLCAGSTPENHQAALDIMRANCIDIEKAF